MLHGKLLNIGVKILKMTRESYTSALKVEKKLKPFIDVYDSYDGKGITFISNFYMLSYLLQISRNGEM